MPLPKSLGMNIGTASNPNDDEMMPFANVFKMSDAPEQKDWGTGTHLAPEPGQLDSAGYYKYIVAGKDFVSYIVARTRQLAAMLLHSTVWVIKWDGTGTATMQACVGGNQSSGSGRLEFTPDGLSPLVLIITGLPASPGDSNHMRNIRILPLAEENSTAIASTPLKQKLAPFAGGVLRPMQLTGVNSPTPWNPNAETRPVESDALWSNRNKGVPVGVLIKLAIECNMTPWITLSHNCLGTSNDPFEADYAYLEDLSAEIGSAFTGVPSENKKIIVEYGNETCFNTQYKSWQDMRDRGLAAYATGDEFVNAAKFYATRSGQMAHYISENWGGGFTTYKVMGAMFHENQINSTLRSHQHDGETCYTLFDAYATAPYAFGTWGLSRPTPANGELTDDYGITIKENLIAIGQAATVTAMFAQAATDLVAFTAKAASVKAAWAGTSLPTWYYEGPSVHFLFGAGAPNTYNFIDDTAIHACFEAFLHDPRIFDLTQSVVNAAYSICDGPACYFNLAGQRTAPSCAGMFGSMKYVSSPTSEDGSTQYRALVGLLTEEGAASSGGVATRIGIGVGL